MNKKIIAIVVVVIAIIAVVIAGITSGKKEEPEPVHKMDNTVAIKLNDADMNSAIDKIISGENIAGDPCVATTNPLYVNLLCDSYEIVDRYYGDHALFVKVKETTGDLNDYTMIRFQLNEENKIIDCITFNIAG